MGWTGDETGGRKEEENVGGVKSDGGRTGKEPGGLSELPSPALTALSLSVLLPPPPLPHTRSLSLHLAVPSPHDTQPPCSLSVSVSVQCISRANFSPIYSPAPGFLLFFFSFFLSFFFGDSLATFASAAALADPPIVHQPGWPIVNTPVFLFVQPIFRDTARAKSRGRQCHPGLVIWALGP